MVAETNQTGESPKLKGYASPLGQASNQKISRRRVLPSAAISYPSQSLRFLEELGEQTLPPRETGTNPIDPAPAPLGLNIIVVGAGLGGLAVAIALARRGHSLRILEQAPKLGEVGAGIQIPPNSGRLLRRWGVFEHLEKWAVKPESINFRRWENGNLIGHTALGMTFQDSFKVPYYVIHRAHFHEALHQRALQLGVVIDLDSRVVRYNEEQGSVVLADGSILKGDLVIAADGINSTARDSVQPGVYHEPKFDGFAAYRATVQTEKLRKDPDVSWILEKPSLNIWIGEDRHVMSYTIAAGESLNMVLSHIDYSDPATWSQHSSKEHISKEFTGWDPQLRKIISLMDECVKWPLRVGRQLKSWISPSTKLIVIGDAAHAMLPYMSQGAAMAVEDGAALAVALNHVSSLDEIPFALRSFEKERIKRSSDMQNASMVNGVIWHFSDGPEQRARDASMAAEVMGEPFISSANQWSDPVTQWWAYGYDAEKVMEEAWARDVSQLIIQFEK